MTRPGLDQILRRGRRAARVTRAWTAWLSARPGGRPARRVLVTSLPKAGTTLAVKALTSMPGLRPVPLGLTGRQVSPARPGRPSVEVGVDWPARADEASFRRRLALLPPGGVANAHLPYSATAVRLLAVRHIRVVAVVRDPRDVALSLGPYVMTRPEHHLHRRYAQLDEDGRLLASIRGLEPDEHGNGLLPLAARVRSVTAWAVDPMALLVRFEDLIGERGGGSRSAQREALGALAEHLGVVVAQDRMEDIARNLFGGTSTFRRGQQGGWRQAYGARHVAAARSEIGNLLVELGYETDDRWGG